MISATPITTNGIEANAPCDGLLCTIVIASKVAITGLLNAYVFPIDTDDFVTIQLNTTKPILEPVTINQINPKIAEASGCILCH